MGEAAAICIFELAFQKDEKIIIKKKKKQKAKINQQGTIDDRNGTTAATTTLDRFTQRQTESIKGTRQRLKHSREEEQVLIVLAIESSGDSIGRLPDRSTPIIKSRCVHFACISMIMPDIAMDPFVASPKLNLHNAFASTLALCAKCCSIHLLLLHFGGSTRFCGCHLGI